MGNAITVLTCGWLAQSWIRFQITWSDRSNLGQAIIFALIAVLAICSIFLLIMVVFTQYMLNNIFLYFSTTTFIDYRTGIILYNSCWFTSPIPIERCITNFFFVEYTVLWFTHHIILFKSRGDRIYICLWISLFSSSTNRFFTVIIKPQIRLHLILKK